MDLPHYHTMPTLPDPVFQNLFEVVIITPSLIIQENIYDQNINFISEKNSDASVISIIEMAFTFNQDSIKDWNTKDYLNDIGYVLLTIHDKSGNILSRELIEVRFISSKVNFNYSGDDILSIQLRLENLGIEQNILESIDVVQKRLNRVRRLNDLIGSI
jgi:hypothetical protein